MRVDYPCQCRLQAGLHREVTAVPEAAGAEEPVEAAVFAAVVVRMAVLVVADTAPVDRDRHLALPAEAEFD